MKPEKTKELRSCMKSILVTIGFVALCGSPYIGLSLVHRTWGCSTRNIAAKATYETEEENTWIYPPHKTHRVTGYDTGIKRDGIIDTIIDMGPTGRNGNYSSVSRRSTSPEEKNEFSRLLSLLESQKEEQ